MAILPLQLARVSNNLRTSLAQRSLSRTQQSLLEVQNQLTTGKRLNAPSDDPGDAAVAQQLRKTLELRGGYADNLRSALSHLSEVDNSLSGLVDLLRDAQTIASANVGSAVTADERSAAASLVEALHNQAMSLGNRQLHGQYLFAGDAGTQPFIADDQGIRFTGNDRVLANTFDHGSTLPFQVSGVEVFGALTSRVQGTTDLTPALTGATRLSTLRGAAGTGISPPLGSISLSDGVTSTTIDLSGADTAQDVVDAINAASVGGITASIDSMGGRLALNATPADNIAVGEVGGDTAEQLGILHPTASGSGIAVTGQNLRPAVTPLTNLSDLRGGLGLDTSGLIITNGTTSATIDLSGATTVEDLLNAVNGADLGVRASSNAAGTGIDLLNSIQGTTLTIAENGGATATQLGVRSFGPASLLSELNDGRGVRTVSGADIQVTRRDGTSFQVDLSNLSTVQDVIDAINAADSGGGVTASFASTGNGIILTDSTAGAGTLSVAPVNFSLAADDLGLRVAAAGSTFTGGDVNGVAAGGILGNLSALRDALLKNDQSAITSAAESLQEDLARVTRIYGRVGAQVQELESRQERLEDQDIATKALLSQLEDTDYNLAVTRFQTLQTALQANLQTTGRVLTQSLLDFLR